MLPANGGTARGKHAMREGPHLREEVFLRTTIFMAVAAVAGLAIGCGDDNNNNITGGTGSGGTGGTATSGCSQAVLAEQQLTLDEGKMAVVPFTVGQAGRVDVTVQWTSKGEKVGAFIAQTGSCNESQFGGDSCTFVGRSAGTGGSTGSQSAFTGANPGRFATQNVAAGSYDLILMSYGTGEATGGTGGGSGTSGGSQEAVAVQVVSSVGNGCPAFPPAS